MSEPANATGEAGERFPSNDTSASTQVDPGANPVTLASAFHIATREANE